MFRLIAAAALVLAASAHADHPFTYEVTITNVTKGQTFTPQLVAAHDRWVRLFTVGQPASPALEILAEGGDTQPLTDDLLALGDAVSDVTTIGGLLGPGQTATVTVQADPHDVLSIAAMLIPTNDNFVALNGARLPRRGSASYVAPAYDAGSEENDQNCANIPGPRCGGEGVSPGPQEGDEGYVYVSNGFHELGTDDGAGNEVLTPLAYDWRNPVAHVTIRRMRR
jgi:hypothetical protein